MNSAIIVAAGVGKRIGTAIPKQFIQIHGKTILEHTLDKFISFRLFDEIIVVVSEQFFPTCENIIKEYNEPNIKICLGGAERFHSVQNAINSLDEHCDLVFIHDGVRPFCSKELAFLCYEECKKNSNAIPAVPLKDSVRQIEKNGTNKIANRARLRSVQTPQVFDFIKIKEAYRTPYSSAFTDDASVFEAAGNDIHLVNGESANIKITTPDDLVLAKCILPS